MENQTPISKPKTAAQTEDVVGVDVPRLVMPLRCGRYLWDDEKVTVWMQGGEMIAAMADGYMDTPEEIDRMFRDENSEHHQTSPELPWLLISECCEDECSGHNARAMTPGENENENE